MIRKYKRMYIEQGLQSLREEYKKVKNEEPWCLVSAIEKRDNLRDLEKLGKQIKSLEKKLDNRQQIIQIINGMRWG